MHFNLSLTFLFVPNFTPRAAFLNNDRDLLSAESTGMPLVEQCDISLRLFENSPTLFSSTAVRCPLVAQARVSATRGIAPRESQSIGAPFLLTIHELLPLAMTRHSHAPHYRSQTHAPGHTFCFTRSQNRHFVFLANCICQLPREHRRNGGLSRAGLFANAAHGFDLPGTAPRRKARPERKEGLQPVSKSKTIVVASAKIGIHACDCGARARSSHPRSPSGIQISAVDAALPQPSEERTFEAIDNLSTSW
jgi:hypothetical protein